ncbi:MAG: hypothetical protein DKM50_10460 [Candidatus Margulisiibacteriota bacterium]|nr:MAG: hypothetical protein A2X43_07145 [Candidatus Margulisbacteria bacterium GWD2_39_127]PZM78738.1 MAG: hypothetical protein DKM50_10460 [Candidatus Margulisiibacteriota bacterium]HAR63360.1 hypothetical protein [Candidatus Margulisiibacteriota bacterium]HCY36417.1 hypothetical protein [Candidatus Margulisiibacteriota bacterium]
MLKSVFLIIFFVLNLIFFVGGSQALDAGQPGALFSYGADARSFAMGRTYVTNSKDASSVYRNPACLVDVPKMSFLFMSASMFQAYSYSVLSFVYPGLYETYGGGLINLSDSVGFIKTDKDNNNIGSFNDKSSALCLGYAKQFDHKLSYGIGFKMFNRELDVSSDSFFVFDLGLNYKILDKMTIGAVLNNIYVMNNAPSMTADTIPMVWRGGISYADNDWIIAYDITDSFDQWYLGAEYKLLDMLYLRSGINYNELTFGIGIEYLMFKFDLALGKQETIGDTMKFSMVLNFGDDKKEVIKKECDKLILEGSMYQERGFYNLSRQSYSSAGTIAELTAEIKEQIEKLDNILKLKTYSLADEKQAWEHIQKARELLKADRVMDAYNEAKNAEKYMPANRSIMELLKFIENSLENQY